VPVLLVVRCFHDALRLEKAIAHLGEEDVAVALLLINGRYPHRSWKGEKQGRRRAAVDDLKRHRLQRCLVRGVVTIFHPTTTIETSSWGCRWLSSVGRV
jgi:hypothetical protein